MKLPVGSCSLRRFQGRISSCLFWVPGGCWQSSARPSVQLPLWSRLLFTRLFFLTLYSCLSSRHQPVWLETAILCKGPLLDFSRASVCSGVDLYSGGPLPLIGCKRHVHWWSYAPEGIARGHAIPCSIQEATHVPLCYIVRLCWKTFRVWGVCPRTDVLNIVF